MDEARAYAAEPGLTHHDVDDVAYEPSVRSASELEVVVRPFAGFGRLAHLRRQLLNVPGVQSARIAGYGPGEARFRVALGPNASPRDLAIPGTRIAELTATLVTLAVVSAVR